MASDSTSFVLNLEIHSMKLKSILFKLKELSVKTAPHFGCFHLFAMPCGCKNGKTYVLTDKVKFTHIYYDTKHEFMGEQLKNWPPILKNLRIMSKF